MRTGGAGPGRVAVSSHTYAVAGARDHETCGANSRSLYGTNG